MKTETVFDYSGLKDTEEVRLFFVPAPLAASVRKSLKKAGIGHSSADRRMTNQSSPAVQKAARTYEACGYVDTACMTTVMAKKNPDDLMKRTLAVLSSEEYRKATEDNAKETMNTFRKDYADGLQ